jgi:hypothetical protein
VDTLRSRLGPVFWFVLIGAILGILFGTLQIGSVFNEFLTLQISGFGPTKLALTYLAAGIGIIVLSVIGLVAGFGITKEKGPSALLVVLAGLGIVTSLIGLWGYWGPIIPAILFCIGGRCSI